MEYVDQHPQKIKGKPGQRHIDVGGGHEIKEVPGIGCEYHSPGGPKVPCPHGMGDPEPQKPAPKVEQPEAAKAEPPKAPKVEPPRAPKIGTFKEVAGKIHGMRRLKGQAIAVIEVRVGNEIRQAAAVNSRAGFTPKQLDRLRELNVEVIPSFGDELVHAEQNISAWVDNLRKQGKQVHVLRWGVSATQTGDYICAGCRQIQKDLGGFVEEFSATGKTY